MEGHAMTLLSFNEENVSKSIPCPTEGVTVHCLVVLFLGLEPLEENR